MTTGHSYGAAIANLAALDLRNRGLTVDLVSSQDRSICSAGLYTMQATFGAPRVGNSVFADKLNRQDGAKRADGTEYGRNYRIVHDLDPIPNLPWAKMGLVPLYQHTEPSYFIKAPSLQVPQPNDIEIRTGPDTDNKNAQMNSAGVEAHRFYMNAISACPGPIAAQH
jgi:hypothetical protein